MPSEAQGASGRDRATYPKIRERIGEDPAQWLDKPLFSKPEENCSPAGWAIRCRIQGIDSLAVLGAWKGVERNLDRGPRDRVMAMLNERAQELEEIGERPERLEQRDGREVPATQWYQIEDGERVPWSEIDRNAAGAALSGGQAVATDGGESDGV